MARRKNGRHGSIFQQLCLPEQLEDVEKSDVLVVRLRGPAQETYQTMNEAIQLGTFDGLAKPPSRKSAPTERLELYKSEFGKKTVIGAKNSVIWQQASVE